MSSAPNDGFVDPTNSPRGTEPQSLNEMKVIALKKMILQGKQAALTNTGLAKTRNQR